MINECRFAAAWVSLIFFTTVLTVAVWGWQL